MSSRVLRVKSPLEPGVAEKLRAGDQVLITGVVLTARDAAHKRIVEALDKGEKLPFDLKGQTLYYMGPSPARPGQVIGSAGPTTSGRMDGYTPRVLEAGVKAMIGKGKRTPAVKEAVKKFGAVYMAAIGGAGALISQTIKRAEVLAYDDLGAEAVRRLEVVDFPAIVINDAHGGDLYEEGKARYSRVAEENTRG